MATVISSWLSTLVSQSRTTQAILIGGIVGIVVYFLTRKRYNYPPGPRGWPLIGILLELRHTTILKKLAEWNKEYGSVITVDLGPMRTVFLNSLDAVQEAFIKKGADFAGRPQFHSTLTVTEGGKDIAFTDYGPTWQLHRKLALKALTSYMKGNKLDNTLDEVLTRVCEEMRKQKGPLNAQTYIDMIVFNILSKICFNEFLYNDEAVDRFLFLIDEAQKDVGNGFLEDVFPPLRIWPTKKFQKLVSTNNEVLEFLYSRVNAHRNTFSPDVQRDLTDALLIAQKELEMEENPDLLANITDTHFAQTINDIFRAGIDTSRQSLYWCVLYIAAFPEVQAKIHMEVDSVLGARVIPTMADRAKLPYTDAVLFEVLRISGPVTIGLPHKTTCDTSVGDFTIPKGTTVVANMYAIHHDPELWDEPNKFKPERFLDQSGKLKPRSAGWLPFSVGKRACLAESLVKPELLLILAALYRNFEIRMPEGVQADLSPEETGIAFIPNPYKVVIRDRVE